MAITTTFAVNPAQYRAGFIESVLAEKRRFDRVLAGVIDLRAETWPGFTRSEGGVVGFDTLTQRRDPSSLADVADINAATAGQARVKLFRRFGPVAATREALQEAGMTPDTFNLLFGGQQGSEAVKNALGKGLKAIVGAISATPALVSDVSATEAVSTDVVLDTLALAGAAESDIVALVMHTKSRFAMLKDLTGSNLDSVAGATIIGATLNPFGRTIVSSDDEALVVRDGGGAVTGYRVLALRRGAATVDMDASPLDIEMQTVLGKENIFYRIQGEDAIGVGVRGAGWASTAPANPTDAQLVTAANWVATSGLYGPGTMTIVKP